MLLRRLFSTLLLWLPNYVMISFKRKILIFSIKPDLIELFFEEIKILHAGYKCLHLGFLFASSPAK